MVPAVFVSAEVFRWGGHVGAGGGLCDLWGRFVGGGWRDGGGKKGLYLGGVRENEVFVGKIDDARFGLVGADGWVADGDSRRFWSSLEGLWGWGG